MLFDESGDSESNSIDKKIKGAADSTVKPIEQAGPAIVEPSIIEKWVSEWALTSGA